MKFEDALNNNEIDLKSLITFLLRNRLNLFVFSFIGFVISIFSHLNSPKIWKGEFQIVLNSKEDQIPNKLLNNFNRKNLQTQVEILSSPSVLLDIFNFVKDEKIVENNSFKNLSFLDWKDNLNVELLGNTSVLNLSYKDKKKEIILPVLKKISDEYISYNTKKKSRDIKQDLEFYENQINLFKLKSIKSYKLAQQFAIDNDLFFNLEDKKNNLQPVESVRVQSANIIRNLKEKLRRVEALDPYSEEILYIAKSSDVNNLLINKINILNEEIVRLKTFYLEKDTTIKTLSENRLKFLNALKNSLVKELKSKILVNEVKVKSYQRPKEILLKFAEYKNEALRDIQTLKNLEDQFRFLSLNLSKKEYPWNLITNPTLLPNPIAPRKRNFYPIGILFGAVVGIFYSLLIEKKKDLIIDINQCENIFSYPVLDEVSKINIQDFTKSLKFVVSNPSIENLDDIGLLLDNDIKEDIQMELKKSLKESSIKTNMTYFSDFRSILNSSPQIIVIQIGTTKINNLFNLIKKLISNDIKVLGFVVIN